MSTKGKTYEEIYGEEKAKELKKCRSEHFSKIRKGKSPWNKGLTKDTDIRVDTYAKKLSIIKTYYLQDYKEKYPTFIKIEKPKFENGKIKVKCKICNKWFHPSQGQLNERLRRFDRNYTVSGNSYLYCSDKCKKEDEEFDRKVDPNQLKQFKQYNSLVYRETYRTIKEHSDKIKKLHLRGNEHNYELDHRYSIYDGFINNISPKQIAHYKNLKILTKQENRSKNQKSSISLKTLLSFK